MGWKLDRETVGSSRRTEKSDRSAGAILVVVRKSKKEKSPRISDPVPTHGSEISRLNKSRFLGPVQFGSRDWPVDSRATDRFGTKSFWHQIVLVPNRFRTKETPQERLARMPSVVAGKTVH